MPTASPFRLIFALLMDDVTVKVDAVAEKKLTHGAPAELRAGLDSPDQEIGKRPAALA